MPLPCTDEEFARAVAASTTIMQVVLRIGRSIVGSNYDLVRSEIQRLSLPTDHMVKAGNGYGKVVTEAEVWEALTRESLIHRNQIKKWILKFKLIPYRCRECDISTWRDRKLTLHLDHINGDPRDHSFDNLRFLCPNCHSQTITYCGRKNRKSSSKPKWSKEKSAKQLTRARLRGRQPKKVVAWPPDDMLLEMVASAPLTEVGAALGCSDNAVRKRLIKIESAGGRI